MDELEQRLNQVQELTRKRTELHGQLQRVEQQLAQLFGLTSVTESVSTKQQRRCSRCNQFGHRATTCTAVPPETEPPPNPSP